ncbi:hypothetical protein ACLI4Q_09390 [Natrialbaceae archaeon A-CW1-1]
MLAELFLSLLASFIFLVAAVYVGTTMALRGFFGPQYLEDRSFSIEYAGADSERDDEPSRS